MTAWTTPATAPELADPATALRSPAGRDEGRGRATAMTAEEARSAVVYFGMNVPNGDCVQRAHSWPFETPVADGSEPAARSCWPGWLGTPKHEGSIP